MSFYINALNTPYYQLTPLQSLMVYAPFVVAVILGTYVYAMFKEKQK